MLKIGMLTSGGDCQGLNAALRGVAKTLYNELGDKVTIYGIRDGYRGLIEGDYHEMLPEDFSDILTVGGTILGTSRQPFKEMRKTIGIFQLGCVLTVDFHDKIANLQTGFLRR